MAPGTALSEIERRRRARLGTERLWNVLLSVFFVVVGVSALIATGAAHPKSCVPCHSSQTSALAKSAHSRAHCDRCHARPDAFGVLDQRLSVVAMYPARLAPKAEPYAVVRDQECLRCHDEIRRGVTAGTLKMAHSGVIKARWACTRCHGGVAHSVGDGATYSMDDCLKCHSTNVNDTDGCNVCHSGKRQGKDLQRRTPWRVTHGPNWQRTHGMGDLETCKACHKQSVCEKCHGMPIPHPNEFRKTHGKVAIAKKGNREKCNVCHRGSACDDCHGIAMPHPDDFLKTHSKQVSTSGKDVCSRCHDKASCDACHDRHTHPGIPTQLLERLKERPVSIP